MNNKNEGELPPAQMAELEKWLQSISPVFQSTEDEKPPKIILPPLTPPPSPPMSEET